MTDGASEIQGIYKKVIIVGGSVAGLTLALALERTDIDFVVLERGDFAPPLGASFVMQGCGMRILDQLGVVDGVKQVGESFRWMDSRHEDGRLVFEGNVGQLMEDRTGYPFVVMERQEILQVLYAGIKDKSRLLARNGAVSFSENDEGVIVTCEDGTVYKGDVLVGADGIHSKVREFMYDKLEETSLKQKVQKTRRELSAEFTCVFGNTEKVPGITIPVGSSWNFQGVNRNIGGFIGKDGRLFFFFFEKIRKVYGTDIPRFTKEDAEKAMATIAHLKLGPDVTVGDMFAQCKQYGKLALEEHMFEVANSDRMCIIGDSLHKMTPNDGWGGTMAIESAAYLANALNKSLSREGPTPSATTKTLLQQFSATRHNRVPDIILKSGKSTRIQAGSDGVSRFVRGNVLPILPFSIMLKKATDFHIGGGCIDYLPKPKHPGTITYIDEQPPKKGWFS